MGPCRAAFVGVRLSKIDDYLVDNISGCRLSQLDRAVNEKARCGIQASEKQLRRESFHSPG